MDETLRMAVVRGRSIETAHQGDPLLGALRQLPGRWVNSKEHAQTGFEGRGWNMIALPFEKPGETRDYRMLVNQYNEKLQFENVDGPIPNRGIDQAQNINTDQFLFALDYQQLISQISVSDSPTTDESVQGKINAGIHREPGFFINVINQQTNNFDIVRLATIPHGDSVLAMGRSRTFAGPPTIQPINGLPIGATQNLASPYLAPYAAFTGPNSFKGIQGPAFPGFDVVEPHKLLQLGIDGLDVKQTTELAFDTKLQANETLLGGIINKPFVVKQANATEMTATFYIMELNSGEFVLSYAQVVMLEFFPRFGGAQGLIKWPHVSINTMIFDTPPTTTMSVRFPTS